MGLVKSDCKTGALYWGACSRTPRELFLKMHQIAMPSLILTCWNRWWGTGQKRRRMEQLQSRGRRLTQRPSFRFMFITDHIFSCFLSELSVAFLFFATKIFLLVAADPHPSWLQSPAVQSLQASKIHFTRAC